MSKWIRVVRTFSGGLLLYMLLAASPSVFAQSSHELETLVFQPTRLTGTTRAIRSSDSIQYRASSAGSGVMAMTAGKSGTASTSRGTALTALAFPRNSLADLEASLMQTEFREGAYSDALVEELLTAGKLLQEQEAHPQALELFQRASYILRINEGLGSLRQLPVIEKRLESLKALNRYGEVEDEYRHMLSVLQEHHGVDAVETVQARRGLAEWKMEIFNQGIRYNRKGDVVPFEEKSFSSNIDIRRESFEELMLAQEEILKAIRLLVGAEAYDHQDLMPLEQMLIKSYFLASYQHELIFEEGHFLNERGISDNSIRHLDHNEDSGRTMAFLNGRNAYQRILGYMQQNAETATIADYAAVIVELADWHILFDHREDALELYSKAEEILVANEIADETIQELLNPEIPVPLPSFTSLPYTDADVRFRGDMEESYRGYIDVAFSVNRYGRANDVNILGSSDDTSKLVERRLVSMVRDARFRPRIAGHKAIEAEDQLRYYYAW